MRLLVLAGVILTTVFAIVSVQADVPARIGGGNVPPGADKAKFAALNAVGAGMCRIPISPNDYYRDGRATPEKADAAVLMAHEHGITPMFLFEYYTRWNDNLGGYDKWHAIGRGFAERFGPDSDFLTSRGIKDWGVCFYSAVNEPMWRSNNPTPIDPNAYAAAMEGLADGVHSINPGLKVSPGGYQEVPLFQDKNPYIRAVVRLYNEQKLHAVDIHRYWDVEYVPMEGSDKHSLANQFLETKRRLGITAEVKFYTTEMNFKKRLIDEDKAARGFLTALWDALTVVDEDGKPVTEFVLPWNIFNTAERDDHYGMCTRLSPWTPNARGKVLRDLCRLTDGMEIVWADPHKSGVTVLEGKGRKLTVWQNRKGWTDKPGSTFELTDLPPAAKRVEIHTCKGLHKTVPTGHSQSITLKNLPQSQTLMFLRTD